jgi:hypothetical protein
MVQKSTNYLFNVEDEKSVRALQWFSQCAPVVLFFLTFFESVYLVTQVSDSTDKKTRNSDSADRPRHASDAHDFMLSNVPRSNPTGHHVTLNTSV